MPSIEGNQFDERDFRRGAWHQTATMVALLTTRAGERQNVMACEWAMIVTLNPLRFVVSVGPHHATHALIEESGEFGLSFCTDRQARLAHIAGSYSLNDTDKWALGKFPTYAAKTIAAQMIADSSDQNAMMAPPSDQTVALMNGINTMMQFQTAVVPHAFKTLDNS